MYTIKELLQHRMEFGEINHSVMTDAHEKGTNWSVVWWVSLILIAVSVSLGVGLGLGGYKESFCGLSIFSMFCLYTLIKSKKMVRHYGLIEYSYDRRDEIDKVINATELEKLLNAGK